MDLAVDLYDLPNVQDCKRRRLRSDSIVLSPQSRIAAGAEYFASSKDFDDGWFTADAPETTIEVVGLASFDVPSNAKTDAMAEGALIFLDWDDTVLPTTWLQKQGLQLDGRCQPSPEQRQCLEAVAASALSAIRVAKQVGKVVVVTMADAGWVELTCRNFLPLLAPVLESVNIVSAKSRFQHAKIDASPAELKRMAFEHEIGKLQDSGTEFKHVLSIGDSQHERDASHGSTLRVPNTYAKSVKLIPRPKPHQLVCEHEYLADQFTAFATHMGDFDVFVKINEI